MAGSTFPGGSHMVPRRRQGGVVCISASPWMALPCLYSYSRQGSIWTAKDLDGDVVNMQILT